MKIDATVTLRPSSASALSAYATAVSTPGNKLYRHYLSTAQFAAAFAPSAAKVAAVEAVLKRDGLSPDAVSANHLAIQIHATSARMAAAFTTSFRQFRVSGGRVAYANTSAPLIDASIAATVQGVVGLNDLVLAHPVGTKKVAAVAPSHRVATPHVVTGGPQPCSAATAAATSNGGYTADQFATAYNFSPLYQAGDLGAGQKIAMYELQPNLASDIAKYQSCYGTSTPISYVKVDGFNQTGEGGEATLDIENAISIAPKASQIVYQGPNSGAGGYDTFNAIISANAAKIISTSYGTCEENTDSDAVQAENTLFQEAATQGQSLFDAAGDDGSEDCGNGSTDLVVDDPGGQPFVTVVGGTKLTNLNGPVEVVWNERARDAGAGGGGISKFFPMPSYQTGAAASLNVINANSSGTPCGAAAGSYCREEPDVSLDADPYTPFIVYDGGTWTATGGTSGGAPIWAAYAALVNASAACGGVNIGFANPALYSIAGTSYASDFHDITSGNNDLTGDTGLYPAGTGYDMASGLGTLNGANLAASFCPSTPPTGPTVDKSVTKTGTNTVTAALSTTVAGDTVVAFVSGDGSKTTNQHATVTGGGLSWSRVKCTCGHNGTAEIWTAKANGKLTNAAIKSTLAHTGFSVSETVIAFTHTTGVGAKASMTAMTGYPKATLTTTAANSLVFGVGTDPSTATARTVGPNQALFSQVFSGANTYWVQSTTTPVAASGTAVTISDPAPKGHGWSLAVVEIL